MMVCVRRANQPALLRHELPFIGIEEYKERQEVITTYHLQQLCCHHSIVNKTYTHTHYSN